MSSFSPFLERKVAILNNNMRCERNLQYASRIESYFRLNGWSVSEDFLTDLVVISGCGFHESQYEKVRSALNYLSGLGFADSRIVIMGCLPTTHQTQLRDTFAGRTIRLNHEGALDELIQANVPFNDVPEPNVFRDPSHLSRDVEEYFFIRVSQGCTSRCSFCVIREAKGYTKSVPLEEIERQYRDGVARGKRKFCLISEDVLAYGADVGSRISDLLDRLLGIESDVELQLMSIHAMWFPQYAEMLLSLCKRQIIKELRIGIQHVNQEILTRMGRKGKFWEYYAVIAALRENCPSLFLEADVIVGFPGETDEMFEELLSFFATDQCFNRVQHFAYSDVSGAPSTKFSCKVSPAVKIARWQRLNQVLAARSSYRSTSEYDKVGDILFKLSQEKDFLFCKDASEDVGQGGPTTQRLISAGVASDQDDVFSFRGTNAE